MEVEADFDVNSNAKDNDEDIVETDILKLDCEEDNLFDKDEGDFGSDKNSELANNEDEHLEEEIELSAGGILDEETIARGLSNLGVSASGDSQVFLTVTIPGFSLIDISLLAEFEHLQKVEVPYNDLVDISCLSSLKHLLILDASHNKINSLLNFEAPKNLQQVDLSYNEIEEMNDLSAHSVLKKLVLDNNSISVISGLEQCKRLKHLSLAHNKITKIENLNELPLQYLNLSFNDLKMIENLETLSSLRTIILSGNLIRSLSGLDHNVFLEVVDMEENEVIDLYEMVHINKSNILRDLNLLRNPIQELPDYRLSIIFRLNKLKTLDRHSVKEDEKVAAVNMFSPPMEVIASRDHIMHTVYSFLQPSRIWDSTLPSIETPYPILVLVGPLGSGKKHLAEKLVEEFSDFFGIGVSHTTRTPRHLETEGKDYYFVSLEKFENDIKMGKFVQISNHGDYWYGLQMEEIESVAREGLACVVHMELEGVLTLKNTFFEPRYVLIYPSDRESHEKRLRQAGIFTEEQIEFALSRNSLYRTQEDNNPGFFDMVICCDDIQETYKQLRCIVMEYLGIKTPGSTSETKLSDQQKTKISPKPSSSGVGHIGKSPSKSVLGDVLTQSKSTRGCSGAPISRGKVEEESIKRRHSAAKDIITGYVPPLFEQLANRYPKTVPQTVAGQLGLGDDEKRANSEPIAQKQNKAYLNRDGIPDSPDSSISDSNMGSNLSDLDSASELQKGMPNRNDNENVNDNNLPSDSVNPLSYLDDPRSSPVNSNDTPGSQRRPMSSSRAELENNLQRPGSSRHPVLPPIQGY